MRVLLYIWFALFLIYLIINLVIFFNPQLKHIRLLSYLCVALELSNNQIVLYAMGSLTSHAALFIIVVVSTYRIFLDYYFALFAGIFSFLLYLTVAFLELNQLVPLGPILPSPLEHFAYNSPFYISVISAVLFGIFYALFITNFAMNQTVKLHHYITHSILRRSLPLSLVEKAATGDLSLDAPPTRSTVTILFADIVGFTPLSEKLGPETVANLLNKHLSEMADIAHSYNATIDKFIGDSIMLVFGAPVPMETKEQAINCAQLALEFQERLPKIHPELQLKIRIGINTGEVIVGNFGTLARSDYTVIGPPVNIAARLETSCAPGKILVSAETARHLHNSFTLVPAGKLQLKGISAGIECYYVTEPIS